MCLSARLLAAWMGMASPTPAAEAAPQEVTNAASIQASAKSDASERDGTIVLVSDELGSLTPSLTLVSMLEEASKLLREHRLDPTRFTLHLRWVDRATLDYGIVLATAGHEHLETCTACSELDLKHRVLGAVESMMRELEIKQARAERDAVVSPAIASPPEPTASTTASTSSDPQWPARRGGAAALLALGGAAMIVGGAITPLGERHEWDGQTARVYDFRGTGFIVLGIGAAYFVGGVVWLTIEEVHKPMELRKRKRKQPRLHTGFGTAGVSF